MSVMLTSCGLCTDAIRAAFRTSLPVTPSLCKVLCIISAAHRPESLMQVSETLQQLMDAGIVSDHIEICCLHEPIPTPYLLEYHLVCICDGSPYMLRERINRVRFGDDLLAYIEAKKPVLVIGKSCLFFASNFAGNLGYIQCGLYVHETEYLEPAGPLRMRRTMPIHLGDRQCLWIHDQKNAEVL